MSRYQPRLTPEQIAEIRHARNTPCPCCGNLKSVKSIAFEYSITPTTVSMIANGKRRYAEIGYD